MKELGLTGDKFTIRYGVITRHFDKDKSHKLTEDDWQKLPNALQNPFAITKNSKEKGSYRIYTSMQNSNGEYVVVGVDVKSVGRYIEVNAISTIFGRRENAHLTVDEEVIYMNEGITPEQSSLLERPNFAQYPTEQELSDSKGSELSQNGKEDAVENNIFAKENTYEYETEEGKTITYSSEARLKAYQPNLFDYDFSGDTETSKNGNSKTSPNGVQREGNPLLTRFAGSLNSKEGEFCHVERIFRESGSFDFTVGNKVESPEDVAFIFSQLETASVEHSFAVFVKDGNPIVVELCMGDYNSTSVNIPAIKEAYFRIKPDTVYFVHNHPSGNLICSNADVACLRTIERAINKKATGLIVNLKTGRFGVFDSNGEQDTKTKNTPKQTKPLTIYTFDQQVFADDYDPDSLETANNPKLIVAFIQSQRLGGRDKISLLVLNRALKIVANIHTKYKTLLSKGLADDIVHYINTFGGESAVVYGNGVLNNGFNSLQNTVKTISDNKFKILDAVHVDSEHSVTKSALNGDISESEVKYQKREKQKKTDGKASEVYAMDALIRDAVVDVMRQSGISTSYSKMAQRVLDRVNGRVRMQATRLANERFNTELNNFKNNTHNGLLHLGKPSQILEVCGVTVEEITLSPKTLNRKLKQHNLSIDDIKSLVNAIQKPILVYVHGKKAPNMVVVTEKIVNNGKISIALELNEKGEVVDINNVSSIHTKDADTEIERLMNFTSKELQEALKFVVKEKVFDWLNIGRLYSDSHTKNNQKLVTLANVIQSFKNPKILDKKSRKHRVWHGSAYDFDAFDHSHMSEGEGQQVFGWGTYVTEVEGIGRFYAEAIFSKVNQIDDPRNEYQLLEEADREFDRMFGFNPYQYFYLTLIPQHYYKIFFLST